MPHSMMILDFVYLIFMSQYLLLFYTDVVVTLSIDIFSTMQTIGGFKFQYITYYRHCIVSNNSFKTNQYLT